jgi:hypothetical protein
MAVGDLNGDGKLDLAVSGRSSFQVFIGSGYYGNYYEYHDNNYINVLLGNGAGAFTPASAVHLNYQPYALTLADFNGDQRLDIVTSNQVNVFLSNADGSLQAPLPTNTASYGSRPLPAGDFDNDGNVDLVLRSTTGYVETFYKGQGDGTFQEGPAINAGSLSGAVVGDINDDGKLDLVVVTSVTAFGSYGYYGGYDPVTTDSAKVLLGYGDGTFAAAATSAISSRASYNTITSWMLKDFTGDGMPDLAAAEYWGAAVHVSLNSGDRSPPPPPPAVLRIGDATVTEGNTGSISASFEVTLSKPSEETVTVQYSATDGLAINGRDYDLAAGTVTFLPGETSKQIVVSIRGDLIDEYDEGFSVNLLSAAFADIGDAQGLGTITDNDLPPTLTISDVSKKEGNKGNISFTFIVTLSGASEKGISVNFATDNGSATTAGRDYVAQSGTLYFAPGHTSQQINITVTGDRTREASETFSVNLSGAGEAVISRSQGIGSILDDDTHGRKSGTSKAVISKSTFIGSVLDDDARGHKKGVSEPVISKGQGDTHQSKKKGAIELVISKSHGIGSILDDDARGPKKK